MDSKHLTGTYKNIIIGPLSISDYKNESRGKKQHQQHDKSEQDQLSCIACNDEFIVKDNDNKDYLAHLLLIHRLVIADVNLIGDFKSYIKYWCERLKTSKIEDICFKITTNTSPKDKYEQEDYFLLCDSLPEEKSLRESLKLFKLEQALKQQEIERNDQSYSRECLFCSKFIGNNRADILNHMLNDHNFSIGLADNLVYFDEFYDLLRKRFDSLQCFYCEKIFYDKQVLKEHMRKKQHKCINPKNKQFDKFYIINYLEMGKDWKEIKLENDVDAEFDDDSLNNNISIEDWTEKFQNFYCLFCDSSFDNETGILEHMNINHKFDLKLIIETNELSFYSQVKLINYIRRQMYINECYICKKSFEDKDELIRHLHEEQEDGDKCAHIENKLPKYEYFDQPEYYFSTFEDDNLLCILDDDGYSKDELKFNVIPEQYNIDEDLIETFKQIL